MTKWILMAVVTLLSGTQVLVTPSPWRERERSPRLEQLRARPKGDTLAGMQFTQLWWGRILIAGFSRGVARLRGRLPTLHLFGQRAFLASILIASAVMPFICAVWVGKRIESRFVLHGGLIGLVAALIYIGIS